MAFALLLCKKKNPLEIIGLSASASAWHLVSRADPAHHAEGDIILGPEGFLGLFSWETVWKQWFNPGRTVAIVATIKRLHGHDHAKFCHGSFQK